MHLDSPAKLNLYLKIGDKLPNDFHEIYSLFTIISLHDSINFSFCPTGFELKSGMEIPETDNLIYKAYSVMRRAFDLDFGMKVKLNKQIPVGGGLGGGSSNAAATMYAIAAHFKLNIEREKMFELAMRIGSDVPAFCSYFFYGWRYMYVSGTGQKVFEINSNKQFDYLLVNPNIEISTKWAYTNFKKKLTIFTKTHNSIRCFDDFLKNGQIDDVLHNDFEPLIFDEYAEYTRINRIFKKYECPSLLSGSGSTIFGVLKRKSEAMQMKEEFAALGFWTKYVKTIER